MANGGDQFGLADRPDSDCVDSPKESKQDNLSFSLKSTASPQTASSQQVAASAADPDVNIKYLSLLTAAYSVGHSRSLFNMQNEQNTILILHRNSFFNSTD